MAEQKEMRTIELPDVVRVHNWREAHKMELRWKVRMLPMPNTSDTRITVEHNFDDLQSVLLTSFCMALVKGEV